MAIRVQAGRPEADGPLALVEEGDTIRVEAKLLSRGWAAGQPVLIGDNTHQSVGSPQVNSDFDENAGRPSQ